MLSRDQLTHLVGLTEPELVRAIGVPTRSYVADHTRFLEYDRTQLVYSYGEPLGGPLGTYQPNAGVQAPYSGTNVYYQAEPATHVCDVLFEIAKGRVLSFRQRGNACA